jgi:hypothetical protein
MTKMEELEVVSRNHRITLRRGKAGRPRHWSLSLLGGCVLLTTLILLVPSVSANPLPPAAHTISAPFTGTPLTIRDAVSEDCGEAAFSHGPNFDLASGVGRVLVTATANTSASCNTPAIPNEAVATGWFGFSTLNFTASTGSHKVKVTWDLHWTIDLTASGAGSHRANLQTGAEIQVVMDIFDATRDIGVAAQEWTHEVNRTGDTFVHSVGSRNVTVAVNLTFNATHEYTVQTVIVFTALTEIAQWATTGQNSASVNFATGGNKATLVSITEP